MEFNVYVHFNGNCRKAVDFYVKALNLKKPSMAVTYGDMPAGEVPKMSAEFKKRIVYTFLNIGKNHVMFSDSHDAKRLKEGNNITLCISCKTASEVKKFFSKMKSGGTVLEAPQKTSWNECYGMLTDKFGITWMFSVEDMKQ